VQALRNVQICTGAALHAMQLHSLNKCWNNVPESQTAKKISGKLTLFNRPGLLTRDTAACSVQLPPRMQQKQDALYTGKKTLWPESASELFRPNDRRFSAKLVTTFAVRGCHVVSVTDHARLSRSCIQKTVTIYVRIKHFWRFQKEELQAVHKT
jgi:hypothetical protein